MTQPVNGRQLPPLQWPKTFGGALYFLVLATTVGGLVVVALSEWRRGVVIIGIGLLVASASRLALGEYDAGMLRVRRKWFDVLSLTLVGVVLIVLALTVPDQPVPPGQ